MNLFKVSLFYAGAEAPVYLALLPEDATEPRNGVMWYTKDIIEWINLNNPKKIFLVFKLF